MARSILYIQIGFSKISIFQFKAHIKLNQAPSNLSDATKKKKLNHASKSFKAPAPKIESQPRPLAIYIILVAILLTMQSRSREATVTPRPRGIAAS